MTRRNRGQRRPVSQSAPRVRRVVVFFALLRRWGIPSLVGLIIATYPNYSAMLAPKFHVQARYTFRVRGEFMQYTNWQDGWRADSLDIATHLTVTNSDGRSRLITGYTARAESDLGWTDLITVEMPPPAVLEWRAGPGTPALVDFTKNNLNTKLESPLAPDVPAEGWAFFASNADPAFLSSIKRLRLTLFDSREGKTTVDVDLTTEQKGSIRRAPMEIIDWVPPWRGGTLPPPGWKP